MRTRSIVPFAFTAAVLGASCAPSPVTVDMNFPTTAAFMHTEQGRLRIFRLEPDELGSCPDLLDGLPTNSFPTELEVVFDSELTSVCSFRSGLGVPEFGEGPHAYVADMRSSTGSILQGCSIGEVYTGAPNVRIELYPTDEYRNVIDMPITGTPASRCAGGM